ncbi:MAG: formylglycine-generating enzyme family protein [Pseudomonadota bacterium]
MMRFNGYARLIGLSLALSMLSPVSASRAAEEGNEPSVFRDRLANGQACEHCPEMVTIPSGEFMMGDPDDSENHQYNRQYENEAPRHRVTIDYELAVGTHEVTFAQWDACVADNGCSHEPFDGKIYGRGWGREDRPVFNVSWSDAQEYVAWLSSETGKEYRLLSEAEWEYVARGGTTTAYWWGNEVGQSNANCGGCGSQWDSEKTAPVGSFEANAFGVYDVNGNVNEWTEDCWHDNYSGAPADGSAWTSESCKWRVYRGGAWGVNPRNSRAAYRGKGASISHSINIGFRVARTR